MQRLTASLATFFKMASLSFHRNKFCKLQLSKILSCSIYEGPEFNCIRLKVCRVQYPVSRCACSNPAPLLSSEKGSGGLDQSSSTTVVRLGLTPSGKVCRGHIAGLSQRQNSSWKIEKVPSHYGWKKVCPWPKRRAPGLLGRVPPYLCLCGSPAREPLALTMADTKAVRGWNEDPPGPLRLSQCLSWPQDGVELPSVVIWA